VVDDGVTGEERGCQDPRSPVSEGAGTDVRFKDIKRLHNGSRPEREDRVRYE